MAWNTWSKIMHPEVLERSGEYRIESLTRTDSLLHNISEFDLSHHITSHCITLYCNASHCIVASTTAVRLCCPPEGGRSCMGAENRPLRVMPAKTFAEQRRTRVSSVLRLMAKFIHAFMHPFIPSTMRLCLPLPVRQINHCNDGMNQSIIWNYIQCLCC
jgi:hypothetical protein